MKPTSNHLRQVFRRLDGAKFHAILKAAEDGTTNLRNNYRILFVRNPTFLEAGDVVKAEGGQFLILIEHPNDTPHETNFKTAYVQRTITWERKLPQLDPVSGVARDATDFFNIGPLYVNFDLPESVAMGQLTDTRYHFVAGQNVEVGDRVDGKMVKTVYHILGIRVCYAE